MKPTSPHHLLSAYLDGELTPAEREEVERLLAESPAARQELSELEHVGELLRQIPRESLPSAFASHVLDVCLSDTGQFESETLTGSPPKRLPQTAADPPRRNSWWQAVGVAAAMSAIGLIVAINLPDWKETRPELAQNPPAESAFEAERGTNADGLRDARTLPMAPDSTGVQSVNEAGLSQEPDPAKKNQDVSDDNATVAAGRALSDAVDMPERETSADRIADGLIGEADQVAVVKVIVRDRRQALADLRATLQRHQIPTTAAEDGAAAEIDPNHLAVYVETNRDQLAAAIRDFGGGSSLSVGAPVAMAELRPMLTSQRRGFGAAQRNRGMAFGAGGSGFQAPGNQSLKGAAPSPAPAATEEKAPAEPAGKKIAEGKPKSAAKAAPAAKAPPEKTPPERRITAAGSAPFDKLREKSPQPDGSKAEARSELQNQKGFENQNSSKPQPSIGEELRLPEKSLIEMQKRTAKDQSEDPSAADRKIARPVPPGRRVQVLFVLVEQAEPAPAEKPAPAADDASPK